MTRSSGYLILPVTSTEDMVMGDKAWKALERRVAETLGGVRNRMSGAVNQLTAGDVVHDVFFVEIKHRATLAAVTWMKDAVKLASKEGKTALLVLHLKGDKSVYYMFRDRDAEVVCVELLAQLGWNDRDLLARVLVELEHILEFE